MRNRLAMSLLLAAAIPASAAPSAVLQLRSKVLSPLGSGAQSHTLRIDGLHIETLQGRATLPSALVAAPQKNGALAGQATMSDGRIMPLHMEVGVARIR